MTINEKARRTEAVALDVHGVLTDGTSCWGSGGDGAVREVLDLLLSVRCKEGQVAAV